MRHNLHFIVDRLSINASLFEFYKSLEWSHMSSDPSFTAYSPHQTEHVSGMIKPRAGAVSRIVADQALILDPTKDEIRQLNEVGSWIWSMILKSTYTRDDILNSLIEQFEVSPQHAATDLDEFLTTLQALSLIEYTQENL